MPHSKTLVQILVMGLLLAIGGGVCLSRYHKASQLAIRSGTLDVAFPVGLTVDSGSVGVPAMGSRKFVAQLPILNKGHSALSLSVFSIAQPCCARATLDLRDEAIPPGKMGMLKVVIDAPGLRPGKAMSAVSIRLGDAAPPVTFELQVNYHVEEGVLAGWGASEVNFGNLCLDTPPLSREVRLMIQPAGRQKVLPTFTVKGHEGSIRASIRSQSVETGMYQDADVYLVQIELDPSNLQRGQNRSILSVDGINGQDLTVKWSVVDEWTRSPNADVLFVAGMNSPQKSAVTFWNNRGRTVDVLEVSSSVKWLKPISRPNELKLKNEVSIGLEVADNLGIDAVGTLTVRLRAGGVEKMESVNIRAIGLDP